MSGSPEIFPTCASNFAEFEVRSSDGSHVYQVTSNGPEMGLDCNCPAGQHGKHHCKHRDFVAKYACLNHPQAQFSGAATLRPKAYFSTGRELDDTCKVCGGPTVAVKYMV